MALPILDGNQSATTLSTILSSGQHITAHTVVSLGTQAITDISGAVSGSVVSISNFPATQTIAGTVTAFGEDTVSGGFLPIPLNDGGEAVLVDIKGAFGSGVNVPISGTVTANGGDFSAIVGESMPAKAVAIGFYSGDDAGIAQVNDSNRKMPISGTVTLGAGTAQIGSVTVGNSVTIGSLPTISGTVTANVPILDTNSGSNVVFSENEGIFPDYGLQVGFVDNLDYRLAGSSHPFPISGTVTVGSLPAISGTVTANLDANSPIIASQVETGIASYAADLANEPLPIAGTVTVGNSVTIASFATSVTARLINPAGTAVTYAEVGTAGSPSIDVLSVQGVTSGTPLTILNHQGTAVTTSDFTSTTDSTLLAGLQCGQGSADDF
jgi:hypothetical protein